MVKVFFNNSCNICRAEINHYKKHSDNSVEWIDVTNNEEAQKITSKSYKELLRRMHVIQDGKVIDGAESFLIIWKNIPKYNYVMSYKIIESLTQGLKNMKLEQIYLSVWSDYFKSNNFAKLTKYIEEKYPKLNITLSHNELLE